MEFDVLVRAASEIQQAKDNCLEVRGVSGSKPSGGKFKKSACHSCNTMAHSEQGFSDEVRKKLCKAFKAECKKCLKTGNFTEFCFKGLRIKNCDAKKAKVSVVSAEATASDTPAPAVVETPAAPAAPAATLNSVQQVPEYSFNPDRYQDFDADNSGWWAVEAVKPIKVQRLWGKMEASSASQVLGHFIFDNVLETWRRAAPPSHAAKKVRVELDRGSYSGHGRSKVMRRPLDSWAFPDSGAQVTLNNPGLVKAMGGEGLVKKLPSKLRTRVTKIWTRRVPYLW